MSEDLLGDQFKLVGGQVLGQYVALAIKHESANGWHGFDTNSIALRLRREDLVLEDLQLHEPRNNRTQHKNGNDRRQDNTRYKQLPLGVVVLDG